MQSPIRSRILEDAKESILELRDMAQQNASALDELTIEWAHWQGVSDGLTEAARQIDECMEDN